MPYIVMLLLPADTVISHLSASFEVPEKMSDSRRSRKYAATDEKIRTAGEILKYTTEFITVMPFGLNRYQSAVIAPP